MDIDETKSRRLGWLTALSAAVASAALMAPGAASADSSDTNRTPPPQFGAYANPSAAAYSGYYPSWRDNWFDSTGDSLEQVYQESQMAKIPANYNHVIVAFATPNFFFNGLAANNWGGTGLFFCALPKDIKAAIDVLHIRKIKVILAVGGATYNDWDGLAAEGAAGGGARTDALTQFMTELGFDGLDVDYEADANIDRYANASKALRKAVDNAGGGRILTLAGWSTGADCVAATASDRDCKGRLSYWGGNAGRERLLAKKFSNFDIVNVMAYDAGSEHYDGITAWKDYRRLFPSKTIVSIGLEPAPEGWGGGMLVLENADAQCAGSVILQSQYGATINKPYSVSRYTRAVKKADMKNSNPRDGAMLWHILKTASGNCGNALLASPGPIGSEVVRNLGGVDDSLLQISPWK